MTKTSVCQTTERREWWWCVSTELNNVKMVKLPLWTPLRHTGNVQIQLYSPLHSAIDWVSGQLYTPAALCPLNRRLCGPNSRSGQCRKKQISCTVNCLALWLHRLLQKWRERGMKWPWLDLRYYIGIGLEGLIEKLRNTSARIGGVSAKIKTGPTLEQRSLPETLWPVRYCECIFRHSQHDYILKACKIYLAL